MIRWLIVGMVILKFVNYIYITVPDNAEEPWKLRMVNIPVFLAGDLAYFTKYLGYDNRIVLGEMNMYIQKFWDLLYPPPNDVMHEVVYFEGMALDVHRPAGVTGPLPAVLMFDNGGWMTGRRGRYTHAYKRLASSAKVAVFGYSYERRIPDHIFPAAFDDCETVTRHLLRNAADYNVIPDQIGVLGEGAGGNLATAVALKLAKDPENGVPPLAFLAIFNPFLQALDFNLKSYQQYDIGSSGFTISSKTTALFVISLYGFGDFQYIGSFWENSHTTIPTKRKYRKYVDTNLLDTKYQTHNEQHLENHFVDYKIKDVILNPYFAPLMARDDDLIKLPKTFLTISEYGVWRDEGMIFAERLKNLNHELEYNILEGTCTGTLDNIMFRKNVEEFKRLSTFINNTCNRNK